MRSGTRMTTRTLSHTEEEKNRRRPAMIFSGAYQVAEILLLQVSVNTDLSFSGGHVFNVFKNDAYIKL